MTPELKARVVRLLREQEAVLEELRRELGRAEAMEVALELRLGRVPVDGDVMTAEDQVVAEAFLRTIAERGREPLDSRGEPDV